MSKGLVRAAVIAAVLCVSSAAPVMAQVVQVTTEQAEKARRNIDVISRITMQGTNLASAVDARGLESVTTPEAFVAEVDRLIPGVNAARAELARLRAELAALPPVAGPNDPVQLRAIDHIAVDADGYLARLDGMFAAYPDVADAFRSNDQDRAMAALKRLASSAMTVVDGQALMFRTRSALVGSDRSDYAHAQAIACLYDGFGGVMRAQMALLPPDEAADVIDRAVACVETQLETGRAALARERANPSASSTARAIERRLADISDRVFVQIEAGGQTLDQTADLIRAGADAAAMDAATERFAAIEEAIAALGVEQGEAATGPV